MFTHRAVQDLAFIIESECIYQDFDLSHYWLPNVIEKLQKLDENAELLLTVLKQSKSHFLGSYFESLFSYAIRHLSTLTIIFEHLQIIADKKTLGEVDMLVKTPQGTVHQFELAIKFYLQVAKKDKHLAISARTPMTLLGPNKNDTFRKKYIRAKQHQLTILDTPAAQSILNEHSITSLVDRQLLMFGYLYSQFIDLVSLAQKVTTSDIRELDSLVNPRSIQGYWVYFSNIGCLKKYGRVHKN